MGKPKYTLGRESVTVEEAEAKKYDAEYHMQEAVSALGNGDYDEAESHAEIAFTNAQDLWEIARRMKSGR